MLLKHCKFLEVHFNCHIISGVYSYTRKLCTWFLAGNFWIVENFLKHQTTGPAMDRRSPHGSSRTQFFSAVFAMHNFFIMAQTPPKYDNNDLSLSEEYVKSTCVWKTFNKYAYLPLYILVFFKHYFLYLCYLLKHLKRVNFPCFRQCFGNSHYSGSIHWDTQRTTLVNSCFEGMLDIIFGRNLQLMWYCCCFFS